jgi:ABC-type spermidine/putrescine transport system permease subunit II
VKISYQEKIIALWTVFLLGTLFHTQLGLMPLFHGQDIAIADVHNTTNIAYILWGMLGFFILPMFAIIVLAFNDSKRYRVIHFGLTIFYTFLNFLHVVLDLTVTPIAWYQIALMVVLLFIGLLLNVVSWQWLKAYNHYQKLA